MNSFTALSDPMKIILNWIIPPLTTHQINTPHTSPSFSSSSEEISGTFFQYELLIASLSICFCRVIVSSHDSEPIILRWFFGAVLAFLAYNRKPYEVICAFQLFSYISPVLLISYWDRRRKRRQQQQQQNYEQTTKEFNGVDSKNSKLYEEMGDTILSLLSVASSGILSLLLCRDIFSGESKLAAIVTVLTPSYVSDIFFYMFPIQELSESYDILASFVPASTLQPMLAHLIFVTFNIQVGIGYLGIHFLKVEQQRRNELVRMEFAKADQEEEEEKENDEKPLQNGHSQRAQSTANDGSLPTKNSSSSSVRQKQWEAAKKFRRGAAPFIFLTVLPYMIRIIFLGNVNQFAFFCVRDHIHKAVRLTQVFQHDSHLVSLASDSSALSPYEYAQSMDTVVETAYDLFNRKLFSLPKVMLIPGAIMKQPLLLIQVFPFVFLSDFINARVVATITTEVESINKEHKELRVTRTKVEEFDMKNAELLQRSGADATKFTHRRWEMLTNRIQNLRARREMLKRTRGFFSWLQRSFVFRALIDCALANLIAVGRIASADIFVFSRAIEDTVDFLLMRTRAESELATMSTEIEKLNELSNLWDRSKGGNLMHCTLAPNTSDFSLSIRNVQYSRGTSTVRIPQMDLLPGIYAVTGANGSGKSTLFRVLMSCDSNERGINLHSSILMATPGRTELFDSVAPQCSNAHEDECDMSMAHMALDYANADMPTMSIVMPSSDVSEISQNFYWPLFTKPVDWIYQNHLSDLPDEEQQKMAMRVAEELMSLEFTQPIKEDPTASDSTSIGDEMQAAPSSTNSAVKKLTEELLEEKSDWFSELSGGQKSKVELARKVFLQETCPKVLLIDETMAPLDPSSKSMVMAKIKSFCRESIVLVIYHTDVGRSKTLDGETDLVECVPSNDFFDFNLHVENGMFTQRPVC